jgi:methionine sulfoxide reductase heme-binding subunit
LSQGVQALSVKTFDRAKPLLFIAGLYPLLRWVMLGYQDDLTANPVEFLTRSSGTWTLVCLLVTLSISPLRQWLKQPALLRWRRMCGLFTFFYATLHALSWAGWDQSFELLPMISDIWKRPFILVGAAAFLTMTLLAILHYWWHKQGKNDFDTVLIYAAVLAFLLAWRVWRAWFKARL